MPPAITRELSVEYTPPGAGSATVVGGSSTANLLHDKIRLTKNKARATVEFFAVVRDDTEAGAKAAWAAFEDAFSTHKGKLEVKLGGQTLRSYDPADGVNTGFDAAPEVEKPGSDEFDSGRSRLYRVRVEVGLPAPITGSAGARDYDVEVSWTPSRVMSFRVTGTFTATASGVNASAAWAAGSGLATIYAAIRTALGGTWKITRDSYKRGASDKELDFVHEERQLIFSEKDGTGLTADPELVQQQLAIARRDVAPGDSQDLGTVTRLTEVAADFSAAVDWTQTTDLKKKYEAVLSWIYTNVASYAPGSPALVEATPRFDPVENVLSVSTRWLVAVGKVLSCSVTTTDENDLGVILTPVWKTALSKDKDQGPQVRLRTVTKTRVVIGTVAPGQGAGGVGVQGGGDGDSGSDQFGIFAIGAGLTLDFVEPGGGKGGDGIPRGGGKGGGSASATGADAFGSGLSSALLRTTASSTPKLLGIPPYQFAVTELVDTSVTAFYEPVGDGGRGRTATGGGGQPPTTVARDVPGIGA